MASPESAGDLRLANVTKSFGPFVAVDDLSLTVPEGSFFALLGASAAQDDDVRWRGAEGASSGS